MFETRENRSNPYLDLISAARQLDLIQSGADTLETVDTVRDNFVDAVRGVRRLRREYAAMADPLFEKATEQRLITLGIDPETLEPLDRSLQEPNQSDIT